MQIKSTMTAARRLELMGFAHLAVRSADGDRAKFLRHMGDYGRNFDVTAEECRAVLGMTVTELAGIEGDGANDDPGALCIECKEPFYHQFNCNRIGSTSTVSAADTVP